MSFGETKVYFDGSHYIAIPYVPNKSTRRPKPPEEEITVLEETTDSEHNEGFIESNEEDKPLVCVSDKDDDIEEIPAVEKEKTAPKPMDQQNKGRKLTRKQLFEELYEQTKNQKRATRKNYIIKQMLPYFKTHTDTVNYVNAQFERKQRNLICRRTRLVRKVNLQEFNYFCTFTYDGAKHDEDSFIKKLKACFRNLCYRRKWKYVGVWERSPEKQRLHFHGLFYIPDGSMVGELIEVNDYSPIKKKVQHTIQNTYFNERFGRSDFKTIDDRTMLGEAVAYLMKYLEKTGEKIVYSKGLPQYFISDIMDDDIVCTIGQEDKKLLLFDDFTCWDEGCYMGTVSKAVIEQMRKSN